MIILPCLSIFMTGFNYLVAVFLLMFVFGLIFKLLRW